MIFYFAGIGDVPKETFDAARIEGAGHLRMMLRVALPQLRPVTAVVVMLTLFESLKAFDLIAVMTKGAPFGRTNVLGYLVYLESFWNSRFGYGRRSASPFSFCRSRLRPCCSARCSGAPSMSEARGRTLVRLRYAAPKVLATVIALILAAIWIGPLALMVMTSIKPNSEFLNGPFALPIAPTLAPYWNVWEGLHFGVLLENSLIYAATGSALAVGLALVPAFALSRFEPPGKK